MTADNAEGLVQNLTGLLETDNLADQTSDNLAILSSVLANVTTLINTEGLDSSENVRCKLLPCFSIISISRVLFYAIKCDIT